jgi:arylsulfatase A-like enzyme
MKPTRSLWLLPLAAWALTLAGGAWAADRQPNIVVILSDDAGYADFSMHGSKQIPTPHIDSLAKGGVRCTNGYVSCSVCSPTRAGLLTGRYQQRFGHEFNVPPRYSETNGLPLDETTIADFLKPAGYRTIALGKWHLGYAPHFHPLSRGFTDYFGFLQGARPYWPIEGTRLNRLLRDREPIPEKFTYMTDELGKQAAAYIAKDKDKPFFLYLAFNAVHTPMHAKEADLAAFKEIANQRRRTLAAMTKSMDEAVGTVLDALKKHGLADDTLVFFLNDNGGARTNASVNAPLRGTKGTPFEGGIRVPFCVRWPGKLPAGKTYDHPVISLDVLPTALAAAGVEVKLKKPLDGVDLLPYLAGKREGRPHETLYWRRGENLAIRHGDWKLLRQRGGKPMLFDLGKDFREQTDLAGKEPEKVKQLLGMWEEWSGQLKEPRWRGGRRRPKKGTP